MSGAGLLAGRRGLVMGVANDRSIAWGVAKAAAEQGAELAFTFQGEALERRVRPLAASVGSEIVMPCDVTDDASMDAVFEQIAAQWGSLDFMVHAIAYADKDELKGRYVDTTIGNFARSVDISCYSFTTLCQRAEKLMAKGGSIITLTYYGAERVMPHYNVMGVAKAALEASVRYLAVDLGGAGIRVNAIAPGGVDTPIWDDMPFFTDLIASEGSRDAAMAAMAKMATPLGRYATAEETAAQILFLLSDAAATITGSVLTSDGGYSL